MSTPSSPRVPMSPDVSRRRMPRPKDKRRALRDFYGIKQNQNDGPVEYDALLDGQDFSVSSYLLKLNEDGDVKNLLKLENQMIREIRVLDGERKALVYDNYGKMIAATDTIKHVTTEMRPMTKETFSPILSSITQLTSDINAHSEASHAKDDETGDDPDVMLQDWILSGPERIERLMASQAYSAAIDEIGDIKKELDALGESKRADMDKQLNELSSKLSEHRAKTEQAPE